MTACDNIELGQKEMSFTTIIHVANLSLLLKHKFMNRVENGV